VIPQVFYPQYHLLISLHLLCADHCAHSDP
jgi:hypothetical protein